jgi:hypothetical protein
MNVSSNLGRGSAASTARSREPVRIAYARRRGRNLHIVACPYCAREHLHGQSPGTLQSHCTRGAYYVVELEASPA